MDLDWRSRGTIRVTWEFDTPYKVVETDLLRLSDTPKIMKG